MQRAVTFLFILLPCAISLVGILIMLRFPITRGTHAQVRPATTLSPRRPARSLLTPHRFRRPQILLALEAHATGEAAVDPITHRPLPPPQRLPPPPPPPHAAVAAAAAAEHAPAAGQRTAWTLDSLQLRELRQLCEAAESGSGADARAAARRLRRAIVLRALAYGVLCALSSSWVATLLHHDSSDARGVLAVCVSALLLLLLMYEAARAGAAGRIAREPELVAQAAAHYRRLVGRERVD